MRLNQNATVIPFGGFDTARHPGGVDDAAFTKKVLCLGDSWFSIGALPSKHNIQDLE